MEEQYFDLSLKEKDTPPGVSHYFGHGKFLLSGEYVVLDGAQAIALPTKAGQSMTVRYERSFDPKLFWVSKDINGNTWFEAEFDFWNFNLNSKHKNPEALYLQKLLRAIRSQNKHFLRDELNVYVETKLGFPKEWGLGSSSTLIYNLAQWGYVSPFELLFKTSPGSGYDIACAQSNGPILYKNNHEGPIYSPVVFSPSFKDSLYFVYRGNKQSTSKEIALYQSLDKNDLTNVVSKVSNLTNKLLTSTDGQEFCELINEHETILSSLLNRQKVKDKYFPNFNGGIKSLGAWGGDFILAYSSEGKKYVQKYFNDRGLNYCFSYDDIIFEDQMLVKEIGDRTIH